MLIQLLFACGANITNTPNTDLYEKPEEIDSEVTEETEDSNSSEDSNPIMVLKRTKKFQMKTMVLQIQIQKKMKVHNQKPLIQILLI